MKTPENLKLLPVTPRYLSGVPAILALLFVGGLQAGTAAQQITGELGSPSATTTIPGNQLPAPDPKFGGVIKETTKGSVPWWPPRIVPPRGAPNVLLVLVDDSGFGTSSTFGGVIPSPTLDKIAANGLRYTAMHNTALCSPTRAALITGRNHHSVGYGVVAEGATGFPGYDAIISKDKATIGTILKDNGYATSWFGKDHNTPAWVTSEVGPFDMWPSGYGFEYFYGFPLGETDQWTPYLFRDHTAIFPWRDQPPGTWNLVTAMADDAIDWLRRTNATHPTSPSCSTTHLGPRTRHTIRPRSGSTRSTRCTFSTGAGTSCARPSSPTRRSSA